MPPVQYSVLDSSTVRRWMSNWHVCCPAIVDLLGIKAGQKGMRRQPCRFPTRCCGITALCMDRAPVFVCVCVLYLTVTNKTGRPQMDWLHRKDCWVEQAVRPCCVTTPAARFVGQGGVRGRCLRRHLPHWAE